MKSAAVLAMCLVGLVGVSLGDVVMREVNMVQIHGVPGHKPQMRQVGLILSVQSIAPVNIPPLPLRSSARRCGIDPFSRLPSAAQSLTKLSLFSMPPF